MLARCSVTNALREAPESPIATVTRSFVFNEHLYYVLDHVMHWLLLQLSCAMHLLAAPDPFRSLYRLEKKKLKARETRKRQKEYIQSLEDKKARLLGRLSMLEEGFDSKFNEDNHRCVYRTVYRERTWVGVHFFLSNRLREFLLAFVRCHWQQLFKVCACTERQPKSLRTTPLLLLVLFSV